MLDHDHIRINAALRLNDVESFPNIGYVVRGQESIELCLHIGDQPLMDPGPQGWMLKVWIHTWEWTRHG
jgi:hypothetical protein